jgi:hypothetical protein
VRWDNRPGREGLLAKRKGREVKRMDIMKEKKGQRRDLGEG